MLYPRVPLQAALVRTPALGAVVLSLLQELDAERLMGAGRVYGGGLHKLEPRELAGLPAGTHAYFVHGFHFRPAASADLIAETDYGGPLAAAIGRDNLIGTQFHPEKSQMAGLRLIANFLGWRP